MKLSNDEKYLGYAILAYRDKLKIDHDDTDDKLKCYKQTFAKDNKKLYLKIRKDTFIELLKYQENEKYINEFQEFQIPKNSINYASVLETLPEDFQNQKISRFITEKLKNIWIESNFKLSTNQLLEILKNKQFLEQCKLEYENNKLKKLNSNYL
jgi:hypothetical protein